MHRGARYFFEELWGSAGCLWSRRGLVKGTSAPQCYEDKTLPPPRRFQGGGPGQPAANAHFFEKPF